MPGALIGKKITRAGPHTYVHTYGCETTRLFYIVSNYEISTEADAQQGSFGVHDALTVFAVRHHDDPRRRALLADVTDHAQTACDAPPDVAAVVVFEDDVESSADSHGVVERLAVVRRDWLEVHTRADDMELTDDRRQNGAVFVSRRRHHPVADGRVDGARFEALRGALREHARYRRHEKHDVRMRAHDCVTLPALQGDRIPRCLQHCFVCLSPDGTERQHMVTIGDHRHDQLLSESVLQHRTLQTVPWISTQHLKQTRKRRITVYGGAYRID